MSVRTYNPRVRVGNWNEDITLEEDGIKDFLERKEKGLLLIQQSQSVLGSALSSTQLSVSHDGNVHFGDHCMLVNPCPSDHSRSAMSLSVAFGPPGSGPTSLSASSSSEACSRSTFVLVSCDGSVNGDLLKYNQPFQICDLAEKRFLHSDVASVHSAAKLSRHNPVTLVDAPSKRTMWVVKPLDPKYRMELEGAPILANTPVVICHVMTNSNLNLETEHTMKSPLGREMEVTCHTTLDSHRAEKDSNHWRFHMNVPGDPINPVPAQ
ncbi:hypothetical protein CAPTEDRAFT_166830 [Capitella teleta]|uniref:Cilia- and flagella-associated protein 161 n=1 Tax=Capitella teleta TaxID=283909 RepID=R7TG03_CAPTE|nr:hypothetical protein CAPTEDRAFT_166830 [Capitella teleta]|eukprot:ELT92654.1 hypothetical protein CAPTEDRAFT_166830 [Capitella teleta]